MQSIDILKKIAYWVCAGALFLTTFGCTENPLGSGSKSNSSFDGNYHPGIDPAASQIIITQGQNQSAVVESSLPQNLSVIVKNVSQAVVSNTEVEWQVLSGSGTLSKTTDTTNVSGISSVSYTLSSNAGFEVVRARIKNTNYFVDFNITALPDVADSFTLSTVPSSITAGQSFDLTLTVKDRHGNTVTNYPGTLSLTSSDGQAVLPAASTLVQGEKIFTVELRTAGTQTISFDDGSVSITTSSITVNPAGVDQISIMAGNNQSEYRGTTLPTDFQVRVRDAYSNLLSGQTIDWLVTSGGGSLSNVDTTTNSSGLAEATLTLGLAPGSQSVTATVNGTSKTVTFSATATSVALSSNTWNFNSSNVLDFTLSNSSQIELTANACRLKPIVLEDNESTEFAQAIQMKGVIWDSSRKTLRLGNNGSCDGTVTNCDDDAELNLSWVPQPLSIVGIWHMNEASGTNGAGTIIDSSGKGNHATPYLSVISENGKLKKAAKYNGSDYTSLGTLGDLGSKIGNGLTLNFWMKTDSTVQSRFGTVNQINNIKYLFDLNTNSGGSQSAGLCRFYFSSTTSTSTIALPCSTLFNNQWHMVTLITENTGKLPVIYIDGKVQVPTFTSIGLNGVFTNFQFPFTIGALNNRGTITTHFTGSLDEVAIWNSVLTESEIKSIFNRQQSLYSGQVLSQVYESSHNTPTWKSLSWAPTLPFYKNITSSNEQKTNYSGLVNSSGLSGDSDLATGLVGLWHLDEASGTSGIGSIKDSASTNNGTPSSSITTEIGKLGLATSFSGGNSIRMPVPAMGNSAVTLSGWLKPGNNSYYGVAIALGSCNSTRMLWLGWVEGAQHGTSNSLGGGSCGFNLGSGITKTGEYHHLVITITGGTNSTAKLYVNGQLTNQAVGSFNIDPNLTLGNVDNNYGYAGQIDEVAIWSRALNENEIMQLYRRGANRIKYQVRGCTSANCNDDPNGENWKGPDGTKNSYYSELQNTASYDKPTNTPTGSILAGLPELNFSNFSSPQPTSGKYVQYKMILESDDTSTKCNYGSSDTFCSPELKSVVVKSENYSTSAPSVVTKNGIDFYNLTSALETSGSNGCTSEVVYNLGYQINSSIVWHYYTNGGTWEVAGGDSSTANTASSLNASSAAALNAFGSQIGRGKVYLKAFLQSSGTSACELKSFKFDGIN